MTGRAALTGAVAVSLALVVGCDGRVTPAAPPVVRTSPAPAPASAPAPGPTRLPDLVDGWHRVATEVVWHDLDEEGYGGPLAGGVLGGEPAIATIQHAQVIGMGLPTLPVSGRGVDQVESDGENMLATDLATPTTGRNAQVAGGSPPDPADSAYVEGYVDRDGHSPVWVSPLADGEEDYRTVGAVPDGKRWRLHVWEYGDHSELVLDSGPPLYLIDPPSTRTVQTGNDEGTVVVTGRFATSLHGPARVGAWTLDDSYYSGQPERWRPLRTSSTPDGFSDIDYWEVGWRLAGHIGDRPVVYDFDRHTGTPLSLPAIRLDSAHPVVLESGVPLATVMAVQTPSGPHLWALRRGRWTDFPGPPGLLSGLAIDLDHDSAYLLVDGVIWWQRIPGMWKHPS